MLRLTPAEVALSDSAELLLLSSSRHAPDARPVSCCSSQFKRMPCAHRLHKYVHLHASCLHFVKDVCWQTQFKQGAMFTNQAAEAAVSDFAHYPYGPFIGCAS